MLTGQQRALLVDFFRGQPRRTQMAILRADRLNWGSKKLLFPRSRKNGGRV